MVDTMQVLIELDDDTHRRLEQVAPSRSRKRSAFIRAAIQKALWELDEAKTREAYLAAPDDEPVAFDPGVWEPLPYGGFDPPEAAADAQHGPSKPAMSGARSRRTGGRRRGKAGRAGERPQ
jgi:predicted DNA-binding protein